MRQSIKDLHSAINELRGDVNKIRNEELHSIRKDITPNGKNTQRLGDIAARTEEKVENLVAFMERYAEKVDTVVEKVEHHLGFHEGQSE